MARDTSWTDFESNGLLGMEQRYFKAIQIRSNISSKPDKKSNMEEFTGVEEKAFVVDEVNNIIKESIETTVQNAAYHHNKVAQWNSNIVELSLKKLTGLNKPFKYIGIPLP